MTKFAKQERPPRLLERKRQLKSGKTWVGYYYDAGIDPETGKRKEIPLGTDLIEAKRKWAELEARHLAPDTSTMGYMMDRYLRNILPTLKARTQQDYQRYIVNLRKVFGGAPPDAITPHHVAQYRDARAKKSPVGANREVTMLSTLCNFAREWGLMTRENPCRGVRKLKEAPRDYYAEDDVWSAVRAAGGALLQDAMDIAYLAGQRPGDVLKLTLANVAPDELRLQQSKRGAKLRVLLINGDGKRNQLGQTIDRILARPRPAGATHLLLTERGNPLNRWTLRQRFDNARTTAAEQADEAGAHELAARIRAFQFRDNRPKAASDIEALSDASNLLGHTDQEITKIVYRRSGRKANPVK